jgi:hypothetical protein
LGPQLQTDIFLDKEEFMLDKYAKEIKKYVPTVVQTRDDAVMPTRKQFTRLLAAATATRKVPGMPDRVDADTDYKCAPENVATVKDFLMKMYKIDSKESLINYQKIQFRASVQYEQFMTFWKEAPLFDLNELDAYGRKAFDKTIALAKPFYPMLQEKGFYAWDISEYIGICRIAMGCGIIDEKEFDEITDRFVRKAQVFYHSFEEYAYSYICGALFFDASNFGDDKSLGQFFEIQKSILKYLFDEDSDWCYFKWYQPAEREWVDIFPGNPACLITKAALDNGIGYMYHDEPAPGQPDCGWRFFHGDESDDYANDPANVQFVSLNTVLNLCPTILAFVEADVDSAYSWNGKDWIKDT